MAKDPNRKRTVHCEICGTPYNLPQDRKALQACRKRGRPAFLWREGTVLGNRKGQIRITEEIPMLQDDHHVPAYKIQRVQGRGLSVSQPWTEEALKRQGFK